MEEVIDKHGVDFPFLANMKRLGAGMWQGWGVWQNHIRRCSITCPHYLWSIFWGVPSHWFPCQQKCSNNRNLMSLEFWILPPPMFNRNIISKWVSSNCNVWSPLAGSVNISPSKWQEIKYFSMQLVDPNSHGKTLVTCRISAKTCISMGSMGQVTRVLWDCPPSRSRIRLIFPRCCAKRKLSWDHSDDGKFSGWFMEQKFCVKATL